MQERITIKEQTDSKLFPDIIGDEFGDTGDNPKIGVDRQYEPSKVFGFAAIMPKDPKNFFRIHVELEQFEDIAKALSSKKNHEIKSRKLPTEHIEWFCDQLQECAESYAYFVDKIDNVPENWIGSTAGERTVMLLMYSIKDLVQRTPKNDVVIIFDLHNLYKTDWVKKTIAEDLIEIAKNCGKNILLSFEKSSSGPYLHET